MCSACAGLELSTNMLPPPSTPHRPVLLSAYKVVRQRWQGWSRNEMTLLWCQLSGTSLASLDTATNTRQLLPQYMVVVGNTSISWARFGPPGDGAQNKLSATLFPCACQPQTPSAEMHLHTPDLRPWPSPLLPLSFLCLWSSRPT